VGSDATALSGVYLEALALDAEDPHCLYAVSHRDDLYMSDDDGDSWRKRSFGLAEVNDIKAVNA
jgi:hypothetical protein